MVTWPSRLTSYVSLEFPDRMRFFDREPFSATLVRAGGTFETNHLALRVVRIATPLLETSLKLDTTSNASQLQNSPSHPCLSGVGCGTRFEGNKPEREPTVRKKLKLGLRRLLRSGIGFWFAKIRPRSARQDACYDYYDHNNYCEYND